jgi:hypothetical protein
MVRKRADRGRGQSDHAYSPPSPLEQAASKLPLCKFCMKRPAVFLDMGLQEPWVNVFCTALCAAAFAVQEHVKHEVCWCEKHQCWTVPQGRCKQCQLADVAALICPRCGKAHGPTDDKGVQDAK